MSRKSIDEYAEEATRAIGRWYGNLGSWDRYIKQEPILTCPQWLKQHWQRFPAVSPDGGMIIDHEAVPPMIGFDDAAQ